MSRSCHDVTESHIILHVNKSDLVNISDSQGTPFMLMENIQAFLGAARRYGVPDSELFQTADLYERRNIPQVRSGCDDITSPSNI